ncbi:type VII secretion system-associated protein [Streptomyces sp. NPDC048636]|uniref:type VII secretion system-associated protein n=1 Tax=Streptomyces sp. NPDC048636 TaxID=3155762 RepID=UPI0034471918
MNDNTAADTAPPVPKEIEEAARLAPDHWLGMVDPAWAGPGEPPSWAVVGQWRSGLDGEIEEWRENEEYRPSPQAMGWPEPTDEVDEAVQLAATGYGPGEAVPRSLAAAEVAVLTNPDGGPLSAAAPDGTPVVPVFTSPVHLHTAGRFGYELVPVAQLVDRIPQGHVLYLNPSAPVSMTVDIDALREALAAAAQQTATTGGMPEVPVSEVPVSEVLLPETPVSEDTAPETPVSEDTAPETPVSEGQASGEQASEGERP